MDFRLDEEQLGAPGHRRRLLRGPVRARGPRAARGRGASTAAPGARWPTSASSPCSCPRARAASASAPSAARSSSSSSARTWSAVPSCGRRSRRRGSTAPPAASGSSAASSRRGAPGDPILVEHAAEIDALLVLRDDGVFVCAGDDLPAFEPVAPLDPLTPVGRADVLPAGARVGDARAAIDAALAGTVLTAAMLLGVSDAALDVVAPTTRSSASSSACPSARSRRVQAPAGRHVRAHRPGPQRDLRRGRRRSTTRASATRSAPAPPPSCSPARPALENARAAVQVLGGMGFTWEMLPHYLLKRAWVLEHAFGDADAHALALGAALEDECSHDDTAPPPKASRSRAATASCASCSTGRGARTRSTRRRCGAIVAALEAAAIDDTLRVVVLASSGPDFCSGADWVATNAATGRARGPAASSGARRCRRTASSSC